METGSSTQGGTASPAASAEGSSRGNIATKLGEYVEEALRLSSGVGWSARGVEDGGGGEEKEEREAQAEHQQMKVMFREQLPMPFELAMLEAMLQEVGVYSRLCFAWLGVKRGWLEVGEKQRRRWWQCFPRICWRVRASADLFV